MKIIHIPFSGGSLGKKGSEKTEEVLAFLKESMQRNQLGEVEVEKVCVQQDNIKESFFLIEKKIDECFSKDEKPVVLGGDHSITYPCFKSFQKRFQNAGLIILDAHPDCEEATDLASHEDFLRKLINDNLLGSEKCILIGLRSISKNEKEFLESRGILYFDMQKIDEIGLPDVCFTAMEQARKWDACYLSIDIDVVDPAFAPAVHYPEPCGLSGREILFALRKFLLLKNLKIIDLVEIIPEKDKDKKTISLGSKLLFEILQFPQHF